MPPGLGPGRRRGGPGQVKCFLRTASLLAALLAALCLLLTACGTAGAEVVTASSFYGRITAVEANVVTVAVAKLPGVDSEADVEKELREGQPLEYTGEDRTVTVQNLDLITEADDSSRRTGLTLLQVGAYVYMELLTDENGDSTATAVTVLADGEGGAG